MSSAAPQRGTKKQKKVTLISDFIEEEQIYEESNISQYDIISRQNQMANKDSKPQLKIQRTNKNNNSQSKIQPNKLPGITIAKAQRTINKAEQFSGPGPSSYEAKKLQPSQSIKFPRSPGHDWNEMKQVNRVGPGKYNHQITSENKKYNYTFGCKYQSVFQVAKKSPGPGAYSNTIHHAPLFKSKSKSINKGFGTSGRFISDEKVKFPGPGDYELPINQRKSINKKRTISNVGRQQSKGEQKPGPAQYQKPSDFEQSVKKNKGITMGLRSINRTSLPNLTTQSYNKYTINRDFDSQKAPAYSIGNQKRKFYQVSITPSPQEYKISPAYPHSPSAVIPQGVALAQKKKIPGPGAYEVSSHSRLLQSSVRYTFGKAKSNSTYTQQNPGVGRYELDLQNSKLTKSRGIVFGKQKKMKQQGKLKVGVGDYNIALLQSEVKGPTIPKAIISN